MIDKASVAVSRVHRPSASEVLDSLCLLGGDTPITRWELIPGEGDAQELLRGKQEAEDNSGLSGDS